MQYNFSKAFYLFLSDIDRNYMFCKYSFCKQKEFIVSNCVPHSFIYILEEMFSYCVQYPQI